MGHSRTRLSVNVNKVATLRNSRGKNNPDVLQVSLDLVRFGAEGITVHPRPDGRHIRRDEVYILRDKVGVEFNIEGYPSEDFLKMVEQVRPEQCTLVPDPPEALTSNAGWLVAANHEILAMAVHRLHAKNIRVSVFIDPRAVSKADFDCLQALGVDRIELYTEEYADAFPTAKRAEVTAVYRAAAEEAIRRGIGVNAGHDLNLDNLRYLVTEIPMISEVSIGHALISDALYLGFEETIRRYLDCLR
jgi:pyridoxine 5-phosphate synthase